DLKDFRATNSIETHYPCHIATPLHKRGRGEAYIGRRFRSVRNRTQTEQGSWERFASTFVIPRRRAPASQLSWIAPGASSSSSTIGGPTAHYSTNTKTVESRFTFHAFQRKQVAMRNPVRRVYGLPGAAIRALHGHPTARERTLAALKGIAQLGAAFVTRCLR